MVLNQSLILSQDIEYCTVSYISRYISVCQLEEGELMGQLKILPTLAPLFTYWCHSRSTCNCFIPALFSSCRLSSNGHAPWLENDRRIGAHPRTFLAVLQRLQDKRTIEDKMVEWQDNQGYENPFFSVSNGRYLVASDETNGWSVHADRPMLLYGFFDIPYSKRWVSP